MMMSAQEVGMLQALATANGISASDVVRQLIHRAYADQFEDAALFDDVVKMLKRNERIKPADFVASLANKYPMGYVSTRINRVLDRLHFNQFVEGTDAQGYVLTAHGRAMRGY